MFQDDKNLTPRDKKIIINERFLGAIDMLIKTGFAKSAAQIAEKTGYDSKNASRYKKGTGFVGTDDIYSLVNEFDLNPSYLFLKDGPEKESLIIEKSVHIAGNVGNNNTIINEHNSNKPTVNVHGTVGSMNIVHTLENLISEVSPELKEKLLTHFSYMTDQMETLKKTADRHERELVEKKDTLVEVKRELNDTRGRLKKRDAQLVEKDAQLAESNDKLVKTKDEIIGLQKRIYELQSQYVETVKNTEKALIAMTNSKKSAT